MARRMRHGIGSRLVASMADARLVVLVTFGGLGAAAVAAPAAEQARTRITVWSAPAPAGAGLGGHPPPSGALITERREAAVVAGEVRIAGVPATLDPGSVQIRDVTDPSAQISELRFMPGAATSSELLARHIGDPVTAIARTGELAGTLRAVDDQVIAIESGTGAQRRLSVLRRDAVSDIRVPVAAEVGQPSLIWRVRTAVPGVHTVELSYRAGGLAWAADYLAVLDGAGKILEFTAWATITNASGASYRDAAVVLIDHPAARAGVRGAPPPARFAIAPAVQIGRGEAVQVELIQPRLAAAARSVVSYEAMPDPSGGFQIAPGVDCNQQTGVAVGGGRAEAALELEVPPHTVLPDGKVRLFRSTAGGIELVSEGALRISGGAVPGARPGGAQAGPGVARIPVAATSEITGDRHAVACSYDERGKRLRETIEVKIDNKASQPADVVVREFLWRWPVLRVEAESRRGVRAGPQLQEYRMRVPAGGRQVVTYTVVYIW